MCVFLQLKDMKHFKQNFHTVAWVMPHDRDSGVLGVKNLSVGLCDGTPNDCVYLCYFIFIVLFYFVTFLVDDCAYCNCY